MIGSAVDGRPDLRTIARIRADWPGNLVIKGILRPEEARAAIEAGADGVVVSNHGGRQFDGAPASIEVLPDIAAEVSGRVPMIFDSGIRWGLDIIRALALGADFCLLGLAFLIAVAALEEGGGGHAWDVLRSDLETNMIQLGVRDIAVLRRLETL